VIHAIVTGALRAACDDKDMFALFVFASGLAPYREAIGFWAAVLTTGAFAPQLVRTWKAGGEGLSWTTLTLFGLGVWLWFVYGLLRSSGPIMLANGVTGLEVLFLIALKAWHGAKPRASSRQNA